MKNKSLLSLYINEYEKYKDEIDKIVGTNTDNILKRTEDLSYENAIIISEIFGMMPDELFYDDFTKDKKIKEKLSEAKKLHSKLKRR